MGYKVYSIGELCTIRRGASPRPIRDFVSPQGMPWVKIADATADTSRYINKTKEFIIPAGVNKSVKVNKGDLILSNSATPGLPKIMKIEACIHDGWLLLSEFRHITKEYMYYLLIKERESLVNNANGSVFNNLKTDIVRNHKVSVPCISDQIKIANFLDKLNDKLDNNHSIINNLEQLAQTLFKHWFVDFEFPDENGNPYKSSGGKMKETELGLIPYSWKINMLSEITTHSKKTFNPNKEDSTDVAHFSFPAYDQHKYPIVENSKTIKSNKYYIDKHSVMFSRMNPATPRIWMPNIIDNIPNVCSTEFVVLDTARGNNKSFVYSLVNSDNFAKYLIHNATGSTNSRQRVNPTTAISYNVPYDGETVQEYERLTLPLFEQILLLRKKNLFLKSLRDTLLPKLLSGEIEIPDDIEVKEHVSIP